MVLFRFHSLPDQLFSDRHEINYNIIENYFYYSLHGRLPKRLHSPHQRRHLPVYACFVDLFRHGVDGGDPRPVHRTRLSRVPVLRHAIGNSENVPD